MTYKIAKEKRKRKERALDTRWNREELVETKEQTTSVSKRAKMTQLKTKTRRKKEAIGTFVSAVAQKEKPGRKEKGAKNKTEQKKSSVEGKRK